MRALALAAAVAVGLYALPACAATFVLQDGEVVEGTIIDATRNTVTIRRTLGGMRQIPAGRLKQVEITTADGQRLRGRYHGWSGGRAGLEVGAELLWLQDGRVVERGPLLAQGGPPEPATAQGGPPEPPTAAPEPPTVAAAPAAPKLAERADGAAASVPDAPPVVTKPAAASVARPANAATVVAPLPPEEPPPEPAAGPEPAAVRAGEPAVVSVSVMPEEVTEKTGEIVFGVELSRPLDDLLVVIYSTIDGTARAGSDYDALQGMLTLPAGETRGEIRTAVMDDAERQGDKDFQLFLASNPDLTTVAEQWTRVTIRDDD